MILEFEFDAALLVLLLRAEKIFHVRAKRQMQHADLIGSPEDFESSPRTGNKAIAVFPLAMKVDSVHIRSYRRSNPRRSAYVFAASSTSRTASAT